VYDVDQSATGALADDIQHDVSQPVTTHDRWVGPNHGQRSARLRQLTCLCDPQGRRAASQVGSYSQLRQSYQLNL
jgi:hypothetical protein